jgi:3-phenylpropionate/trans-cinnamate dioxygenase ferredoxin component
VSPEQHLPLPEAPPELQVVLGKVEDLYPGWRRTVTVGGVSVLVHVEADGVFAIENACPHYQVALNTGRRRGNYVECPWHHWLIDVRTGECLHNPRISAKTFTVIERDGHYVIDATGDTLADPPHDSLHNSLHNSLHDRMMHSPDNQCQEQP